MKFITYMMALGLLAGCSASNLSTRHQESGLNTRFRYTGVPFEQYLSHTRRIIAQARTDIREDNKEKVVEANAPFEYRPAPGDCPPARGGKTKDGILLIHGLFDSPFMMRDLGAHFRSKCFLVRAILLPGHGTVPGDLLKVRYEEWIRAAEYGIASFRGETENLYVAGFSTGGTLALHQSLQGAPIKALILFAPAVALNDKRAFLANLAETGSKWEEVAQDRDYAKYESFAMNAAGQIYSLTKRLGTLSKKRSLDIPIFIALSADDTTVDSAETVEYFRTTSNPKSRMLLYSNERKEEEDSRITRSDRALDWEHVLDFSHIALTIHPGNPHYGVGGDYKNCQHYLEDPARMKECWTDDSLVSGEVTDQNKEDREVFRRLSYNPDFENMMLKIDSFLASIEKD